MYDKGLELGLTGEALKLFSYTACEVMLTVDVKDDGNSTITAVDGKPIVDKTGISKKDIELVAEIMESNWVWSNKREAWIKLKSVIEQAIGE